MSESVPDKWLLLIITVYKHSVCGRMEQLGFIERIRQKLGLRRYGHATALMFQAIIPCHHGFHTETILDTGREWGNCNQA
jgi:hypothetical protein